MQPKYADIIIVAVIYQGEWRWYISDKDVWLLDLKKYKQAFLDAGIQVPENDSYRFNIPIVNQETAAVFLEKMGQYRVDKATLSKMVFERLPQASTWEDTVDLCPVLLVDFDQSKLKSLFPEPIQFEIYIPEG